MSTIRAENLAQYQRNRLRAIGSVVWTRVSVRKIDRWGRPDRRATSRDSFFLAGGVTPLAFAARHPVSLRPARLPFAGWTPSDTRQ